MTETRSGNIKKTTVKSVVRTATNSKDKLSEKDRNKQIMSETEDASIPTDNKNLEEDDQGVKTLKKGNKRKTTNKRKKGQEA